MEIQGHKAVRPMNYKIDRFGRHWLCDADASVHFDLENQGCWNDQYMAFTRDD